MEIIRLCTGKTLTIVLVLALFSLTTCTQKKSTTQDSTNDLRTTISHVTSQYIELFNQKDIKNLVGLMDDSCICWYPYAEGSSNEYHYSRDTIYERWKGIPDWIDVLHLEVLNIYIDTESLTSIVQAEGKHILSGNTPYNNRYLFILNFSKEGRIIKVTEYYNPIPAIKAFGGEVIIK